MRVVRAFVAAMLFGGTAHGQAPGLASVTANVPACDTARATCIGIRLHVPVTDAGPIAAAAWVERQLAAANQHFEALDVAFQIVGVEPLPATAERVEDRAERSAFGARMKGRVIDVFITGHLDDIDKPGAMAYGVTWRPGGDRKLIIVSTQAREHTLAHELGHLFGLPHSKHAVSIMNKTPRDEPPVEDRTFHENEVVKMKARLRGLLRARVLQNLKIRSRAP